MQTFSSRLVKSVMISNVPKIVLEGFSRESLVIRKALGASYELLSILYENKKLQKLRIKIHPPRFSYSPELEDFNATRLKVIIEFTYEGEKEKRFLNAIATLPSPYGEQRIVGGK